MRSSVDFPQPDGPTMQTNSPGEMVQIDIVEREHAAGAADIFLAQSGDLDRRAAPLDRPLAVSPLPPLPVARIERQRNPGASSPLATRISLSLNPGYMTPHA